MLCERVPFNIVSAFSVFCLVLFNFYHVCELSNKSFELVVEVVVVVVVVVYGRRITTYVVLSSAAGSSLLRLMALPSTR